MTAHNPSPQGGPAGAGYSCRASGQLSPRDGSPDRGGFFEGIAYTNSPADFFSGTGEAAPAHSSQLWSGGTNSDAGSTLPAYSDAGRCASEPRKTYFDHRVDRELWAAEAKACRDRRDMKAESHALARVAAATNAMLVIENGGA